MENDAHIVTDTGVIVILLVIVFIFIFSYVTTYKRSNLGSSEKNNNFTYSQKPSDVTVLFNFLLLEQICRTQ